MLKLVDIVKDYGKGENVVKALKGINLEFRKNEFVSILGQSGCGKTTMLNIVGGLDRYSAGDLIIDGVSTKNYTDVDWDLYRNKRIGFIFQSYNLISHISILANVEMALTLSGVAKKERTERAKKALADVGLSDQINKKPNQLSGGQMQRVSIARALINDPDIILADEPTGALDSSTSTQIMDMLKQIANDRLIIMVTHNADLADKYSTRIIRLNDGEVVDDTNSYDSGSVTKTDVQSEDSVTENIANQQDGQDQAVAIEQSQTSAKQNKQIKKNKKKALKKTSMNLFTALKLSFNNLMTKKGRTIMTSIAGSIGIIGVALVLAISNGFTNYIQNMQTDMLAGYPITISTQDINTEEFMNIMMGKPTNSAIVDKYPELEAILPKNPNESMKDMYINNNITADYVRYVDDLKNKNIVSSIKYGYDLDMNVIGKINNGYSGYSTYSKYEKINNTTSPMEGMAGMLPGPNPKPQQVSINWHEMSGGEDFIMSQYDVLAGAFPKNKNQVALIISDSNQINQSILAALGLDYSKEQIDFGDIIGANNQMKVKFKIIMNNQYYKAVDNGNQKFAVNDLEQLFNSTGEGIEELGISCILRAKADAKITTLDVGVAYSDQLTDYVLANALTSDVVTAQIKESTFNLISGLPLGDQKPALLRSLGGTQLPSYINIFPKDFETKEQVKAYLDEWNDSQEVANKIVYADLSKTATNFMGEIVKIISIVLVCFAAVSLIVSSVMIGIITYVSVVERTKEIGILRSLGARKFDISNVFNAETSIIGFIAGMIGVIVTYILSIPINLIINAKIQINSLCSLNPLHALIMVALSVTLTIIAGLIPSRIASKKDPVNALRTE